MPDSTRIYDLAIIGGGINGTGIARDAAGRGFSTLLVEAEDLGGATSSNSSKLIHGGLRYLEYREFRLVRESLAEREVLAVNAPHMVRPLRFVLPHVPDMRPRLLIRMGLFLYDHLARRQVIPGSTAIDLASTPQGAPLHDTYRHGFTYWDCWVDDARLVVINARAAAELGADIRCRTRCLKTQRRDGAWHLHLRDEMTGQTHEAVARGLVNAAGPWVGQVAADVDTGNNIASGAPSSAAPGGTHGAAHGAHGAHGGDIRLVKGSHIVVPKLSGCNGEDAYILQNHDRRVVFILPFEESFSLIGTTDVPYEGDARDAHIDETEIAYLLDAVGRFAKAPPIAADIVWSYSGVRPLYGDDDSVTPAAATRDYHLELEGGGVAGSAGSTNGASTNGASTSSTSGDNGGGEPPLLTVMGGKITTYRRLAEEALNMLEPVLNISGGAWTASVALPGGDLPAKDFSAFVDGLVRAHEHWDRKVIAGLARRHGSRIEDVIGDARDLNDMGQKIASDLYEREAHYMAKYEWAREPEDILWRRTKAGVHLSPEARETAAEILAAML